MAGWKKLICDYYECINVYSQLMKEDNEVN